MLRASADDDGVASFRGVQDDTLGNLQDAFAVDDVELMGVEAAFVAPAQKRFEEAVVERIGLFLANLDDGFGTIREPRDLFGEQSIPKLPAQLLRKQLRDFAAAAAVFALNGNDFDHCESLTPALMPSTHHTANILHFAHSADIPASAGIIFLQNKRQEEHDRRRPQREP